MRRVAHRIQDALAGGLGGPLVGLSLADLVPPDDLLGSVCSALGCADAATQDELAAALTKLSATQLPEGCDLGAWARALADWDRTGRCASGLQDGIVRLHDVGRAAASVMLYDLLKEG